MWGERSISWIPSQQFFALTTQSDEYLVRARSDECHYLVARTLVHSFRSDVSLGISGAVPRKIVPPGPPCASVVLSQYDDEPFRSVFVVPILDRKSTRLNSSHSQQSRMPSSA